MRRILVELPKNYVDDLGTIARREKLPRAEIVRQAVAAYIDRNKAVTTSAFGIWKKRKVDGIAYQEDARSEWR
jgi:metal-responsive CopG/Arc/MetJ family transcriptional regulator